MPDRDAEEPRRSDRGTTLIEVLVSMSVFSLCMALVFGAVIVVVTKGTDVQKSATAVGELRIALAQIDRQVRSGNVLYSPAGEHTKLASCTGDAAAQSGTCMRIFTQANGSEKCVQWQILPDPAHAGTNLLRTRSWAADWQTSGDATGWATVARGLASGGPDPFTLQGASTAYRERLLDVRLEVFDERLGRPVTVRSSLSGRNTTYGYTTEQCTPLPPA